MDFERDAATRAYIQRSLSHNMHERQSLDHRNIQRSNRQHNNNLTSGHCIDAHTADNVRDATRILLMNLKTMLSVLFGIDQDCPTRLEKCLENHQLLNYRSTLAHVSTRKEMVLTASIIKAIHEVKVNNTSLFPESDGNNNRDNVNNMFNKYAINDYCKNIKKRNASTGNQVVYDYLINFQHYLLYKLYDRHILGDRILIKTAGWNIVGKEVSRRITLKTIEREGFALANARLNTLVECYLQALSQGIVSVILSKIERVLQEHNNISMNLEIINSKFGKENAEKIMDDLTETVFSRQSYLEEFIPIAKMIAIAVTREIAKAVQKGSKTNNELELVIHAISKIVVWSERFVQIVNIRQLTSDVLGDLDKEMELKVYKLIMDLEHNQSQEVNKNVVNFKKEFTSRWISLLCEKVGQIIKHYIVSPVLKEDAYRLVRHMGTKLQEAYQSNKENRFFERFKQLKQLHREKLQIKQQCDENTSISQYLITEKYHKHLQRLMTKTKNPDLVGEIVRENIPMDMICVNACAQVVPEILKDRGFFISRLTIVVEKDDGTSQIFSITSEESDTKKYIPLELKNNHFEFSGSTTSEVNETSDLKNNCLYEALSKAIPELKNIISPEGFRIRVADCIKDDIGIRYHIQQGWHQLPIARGVFGGRPYKFAFKPFKLSKEAENLSPFQHSNGRGAWNYDEFKDVDLRHHTNLGKGQIHAQRAEAFLAALMKINQGLNFLDGKCEALLPSHFTATKYDTILCRRDNNRTSKRVMIALYPVEFETKVVVRVPGEEFEYKVKIDVDNPIIEDDLQGPHGPHVGYKLIRPNKRAPEGISGHILLNRKENESLPDRGRGQPVSDEDQNYTKVPIIKLFTRPIRDRYQLVRAGTRDLSKVDKSKYRGRSLITHYF